MKQSEKPQNAGTVLKKIRTNSSVNLIIILILMIVAIYIASPAFRSWSNMISVARLFAPIAIAGFGVCLVIITGGIDLSMGSIYGLAGVVSALFMSKMEFNRFYPCCLDCSCLCCLGCLTVFVSLKSISRRLSQRWAQ